CSRCTTTGERVSWYANTTRRTFVRSATRRSCESARGGPASPPSGRDAPQGGAGEQPVADRVGNALEDPPRIAPDGMDAVILQEPECPPPPRRARPGPGVRGLDPRRVGSLDVLDEAPVLQLAHHAVRVRRYLGLARLLSAAEGALDVQADAPLAWR